MTHSTEPHSRPARVIHWRDAIALLETGHPCDLKLWKLSTGDILHYRGATCVGGYWEEGSHRVRLAGSNLIRKFRDITLFEINGYEIIR